MSELRWNGRDARRTAWTWCQHIAKPKSWWSPKPKAQWTLATRTCNVVRWRLAILRLGTRRRWRSKLQRLWRRREWASKLRKKGKRLTKPNNQRPLFRVLWDEIRYPSKDKRRGAQRHVADEVRLQSPDQLKVRSQHDRRAYSVFSGVRNVPDTHDDARNKTDNGLCNDEPVTSV